MIYHFDTEQWIPVPTEIVFRFFANPENLPRIMPPSTGTRLLDVKLVRPCDLPANVPDDTPVAGVSSEIVTSFRVIPFLPLRKRWTARITEFEWNHFFGDTQQEGPFKSFHHRHELQSATRNGVEGTTIHDKIDYEIGLGPLDFLANIFLSRQLNKTFRYRQEIVAKLLQSQ